MRSRGLACTRFLDDLAQKIAGYETFRGGGGGSVKLDDMAAREMEVEQLTKEIQRLKQHISCFKAFTTSLLRTQAFNVIEANPAHGSFDWLLIKDCPTPANYDEL